MTIQRDFFRTIPGNSPEYFLVDFSADAHMENDGIGPYEFWGAKGYDAGHNYPELDDNPTWDKTKFTAEQNAVIEAQPQSFWDQLENDFCVQYQEEYNERMAERYIEQAEERVSARERQINEWNEKYHP